MRKPRDVWTPAEKAEIDRRAQVTFEELAAQGDFVDYAVCWELAELGFITKKLEEIKNGINALGKNIH